MSAPSERRRCEAKLAVFWGHRTTARSFSPIGLFVPVADVPLIAGFRTIEQGHIDIWPTIQREYPELRSFEYDEVPRGRVNWREDDRKFLVLVDGRLRTDEFLALLFALLGVEPANALILSDLHYR